jgi:3-phosphoshikimate 1-carboxyvinyltransferase
VFEPRIPGSKSATLRALMIAALQQGRTEIHGALRADDTDRFASALAEFGGITVKAGDCAFFVERDRMRLAAPSSVLDVGHGATPARFLMAFAALADGTTTITGSPRLRERAMADLVESLRSIGVPSECIERAGHLPVAIRGTECAKREARVRGDASSQFASALMLMLSFEDRAASIRIEGDAVSKPYLELTRRMLAEAGVAWSLREPWLYCRERGAIRCDRFDIEPDASSAGYFFALAAATRSKLIVRGIRADSVQADLALLDPLLRMGCSIARHEDEIAIEGAALRGVEADLADAPDCAPTLAALATLAKGPTTITGIGHLRDKESDRIAATCSEAERLGAKAESGPDWLRIEPAQQVREAVIQTYEDHRIAMAFSVIGAARPGIAIENPDVVTKSFPEWWQELDRFLAGHGVAIVGASRNRLA